MGWRQALAWTTFVGIGACSSFGSSSGSDPFASDGAAPPSDGGIADAADAGVAFCQQSGHPICFDFDDGRVTPEGTSPFKEANGQLELTKTTFHSAPFALASTVRGHDAGTRPRAVLIIPLPDALRRTQVDADVMLSSHSGTTGSLGVVSLQQDGTPASTSVLFSGNFGSSSSIAVSTYAPAYDASSKSVPLQTGLFYHLTFVVEPTPGAANIALTVGPFNVQLNGVPFVPPSAPSPVTLHLGLRAHNATSPEANVIYDNVTVSFD